MSLVNVPINSGTSMSQVMESDGTNNWPVVTLADGNKNVISNLSVKQSPSTFNTGQIASIGTAEQLIVPAGSQNFANVRNTGGVDMYVGPAGVTTTTGYLIKANESFDFRTGADIYGITASGTTSACWYTETAPSS